MAKPPITDVTEQKRLNDAREAGIPWKKWGPVPQRAAVGHGPRGLQRRRQRVGLLHPRPGALAGLPLGRGRAGRHLRRQAAPVLRARAVERARPDPQGAPVRAHQQRGQPRRGREGVLLLRRQHAHALVHEVPLQVSPAGVSVPGPRRDEPGPLARGLRVRAARHRRVRRRPVLRRVRRVREGRPGRRPRPHHRAQPRAGGGAAARAADAVVPQHVVVGRRRAEAVAARGGAGRDSGVAPRAGRATGCRATASPELLFTENESNAGRLWGQPNAVALRQGRVPRLRRLGPGARR